MVWKMYLLSNMAILGSYVSFQGCSWFFENNKNRWPRVFGWQRPHLLGRQAWIFMTILAVPLTVFFAGPSHITQRNKHLETLKNDGAFQVRKMLCKGLFLQDGPLLVTNGKIYTLYMALWIQVTGGYFTPISGVLPKLAHQLWLTTRRPWKWMWLHRWPWSR